MKYLKLDLHTHPFEAMGFPSPSVDAVAKIVKQIKRMGLDGVAITEHEISLYGFKAAEIAKEYFPEVLIIPGVEIDVNGVGPITHRHVVELYLEGRVFRFQAHPYDERLEILRDCQGIEIRNYLHKKMDKELAEQLALSLNLIPLRNSDAHKLEDIGKYYNILSIEMLYERAKRAPSHLNSI